MSRKTLFGIPTGFRHKAQGCEERATLGNVRRLITTATRLRHVWAKLCLNRFRLLIDIWFSQPRTGVYNQEWVERYVWD